MEHEHHWAVIFELKATDVGWDTPDSVHLVDLTALVITVVYRCTVESSNV